MFLSSIAWNDHYQKYGFTKVIGEELCEYYWRNHQIRYLALRPGSFTPWDSYIEYGTRFLSFGVDRRDVLDAVVLAVENQSVTNGSFTLLRDNVFTPDELQNWKSDACAILERRVPGAAALIEKYHIDVGRVPDTPDIAASKQSLGWQPKHNFLTWLADLKRHDAAGTLGEVRCDYPPIRV